MTSESEAAGFALSAAIRTEVESIKPDTGMPETIYAQPTDWGALCYTPKKEHSDAKDTEYLRRDIVQEQLRAERERCANLSVTVSTGFPVDDPAAHAIWCYREVIRNLDRISKD